MNKINIRNYMKYGKIQMLYRDYKWSNPEDHDNPYLKKGIDNAELNRLEGYEVLFFINQLAPKYWQANIPTCQKIEGMLRNSVPLYIKNRKRIENWIINNW
ncbi:MAG TPA: hypothetical protein VK590_08730 [Saprospiraceae bacterium]|nr:hypothetical protein [Saprospiraceae bacterium]